MHVIKIDISLPAHLNVRALRSCNGDLSPLIYSSQRLNNLFCSSLYRLHWILLSFLSDTSFICSDVNLASLCRRLTKRQNWRLVLPAARLFNRLCHPSLSLFVRTDLLKALQVEGGHTEPQIHLFEMCVLGWQQFGLKDTQTSEVFLPPAEMEVPSAYAGICRLLHHGCTRVVDQPLVSGRRKRQMKY